jgi:hypothetical protein
VEHVQGVFLKAESVGAYGLVGNIPHAESLSTRKGSFVPSTHWIIIAHIGHGLCFGPLKALRQVPIRGGESQLAGRLNDFCGG